MLWDPDWAHAHELINRSGKYVTAYRETIANTEEFEVERYTGYTAVLDPGVLLEEVANTHDPVSTSC